MYEYGITQWLSVSFQRFPYPVSGVVHGLPSSRGALPIHVPRPGLLAVPSPPGEAFWIALLDGPGTGASDVGLLALDCKGAAVDVLTGQSATSPMERVTVPPHQFVAGIRREPGTWWAFAREASGPAPATAAVDLIIRTSPAPDAGPARPAAPAPLRLPGGEAPDHGLPRSRATATGNDIHVRVIIQDQAGFELLAGQTLGPMSPHPAPGRLP